MCKNGGVTDMSNTTIFPTLHVSLSEYQAAVSSIHSLKSLYEYILLLFSPPEYFFFLVTCPYIEQNNFILELFVCGIVIFVTVKDNYLKVICF